MAEDTRTTCSKGLHPREDVYVYPSGKRQCRSCKRAATEHYLTTPKGRVATAQASHRYEMSLAGFLRGRARNLRARRAVILRQLAELAEEEKAWT